MIPADQLTAMSDSALRSKLAHYRGIGRNERTVRKGEQPVTTPRDPRSEAPEFTLDLSRSDAAIHRDLRARWPDPGMWWELEPDEKSGWVYNASKILAKLVHVESKP